MNNLHRCFGVAALVLLALYGSGWLVDSANISNAAQFASGAFAAVMCALTAWKSSGVERFWRGLLGLGMGAWTCGQVIYAWHRFTSEEQLGSPSWADAGYLCLPIFAIVALTVLVSRRGQDIKSLGARGLQLRVRSINIIWALVISGAMFVVTWSTRGVRGPVAGAIVVGTVYLISDVVLVVTTVLLGTVWAVPLRFRRQLRVLALALACISVSDGIYAYLVRIGVDQFPPTDAGYVAGPFLIGLAVALNPAMADGGARPQWPRLGPLPVMLIRPRR